MWGAVRGIARYGVVVPRRIHAYVDPRRFVAGTVGMPGERTFFLQATGGDSVTSVSLEKAQVALLADRLEALPTEAGVMAEPFADDNDPLTVVPYLIPNSAFIFVLIGTKIKANFDLIKSRYLINRTKVNRNKTVDGIIYHALIFLSRNVWIPIPVIVPYNRMLCNM